MSFFANTKAQTPATPKKVANISDDQINSNQQAVPVKYLAGRQYVTGDYISPAYNPKAVPIQTQAGKGNSETVGYKYYADFALVFCMGGRRPVDGIYSVIVDSDIVWTGNVTRGNAQKEVITVPNYGIIHLYWGSETQGIDSVLLSPRSTAIGGGDQQDSTTWPANAPGAGVPTFGGFAAGDVNPYSGHYDKHPAYRGQCYGVFKTWKLGRDRTSVPNIQLELKRGCPWFNNQFIASDNRGVNPAAFLYDMFTDTRFGAGLPDTNLGQTAWTAAYNALEALSARISPVITGETDFRQLIAQALEYFNGFLRRNGAVIELGVWPTGTPVSAATLTDDDLLSEPDLTPTGWNDTLNEVTIVYKDKDHHFNDYTQVYRSPNNFRVTGSPRPETIQRPWITDKDLAKQYVSSYGAIQALPYTDGTLDVKREFLTAHNLLPGKTITYNSAFYGLSFLLRINQIEYPADRDAKATLSVEWDRAKWPSLYIPPGFQGPGGFILGPRGIWQSRITEIPYLLLDKKFLTQIVPLAIKGNHETTGFRVWASFDNGANYHDLSNSNNFGFFGRVNAAIGTTDPGVGVNMFGIGQDNLATQNTAQQQDDTLLLFIDAEVMSVGRVIPYGNGFNTMNILRHRLGTAAQSHARNANCFFIFRKDLKLIDNAKFIPGAAVLFKLQPFTHQQDYDLASITPISYTIVGWGNIAPPILSPPAGPFVGSVLVHATAQTGMTIRYEQGGSAVNGTSPIFPTGGKTLTNTTTLRLMAFASDGRTSAETIATYTKVASLPPGNQKCSPPAWDFTGNIGYQAGTLTLTATTVGSTIKFKRNNGSIQTYGSPLSVACNNSGDVIEFWATKGGLDDSDHITLDNTQQDPRGGGHGPPNPP